jgi:hypothetical protein
MFIRKAVLCASFVLGAIALPASAQIVGSLTVDIAPPAPRVEVIPAPRTGYTWAPGYYRWEEPARSHERDRRYYYEPGRFEVIVR